MTKKNKLSSKRLSKNKYLKRKQKKTLRNKKSSLKKGKKQKKRKPKSKSKSKSKSKTVLINGGGCSSGCASTSNSNSFKNYIANLRETLDVSSQGGGGYSINPSNSIKGFKSVVKQYDDLKPPVIVGNELVDSNCL